MEVNLYGEGRRDGEEIVILGESKSRMYEREVREFAQNISALKSIKKETIKLMFGFYVHPSASEEASKHNIILVASYQR